jgi:hypothetical protein
VRSQRDTLEWLKNRYVLIKENEHFLIIHRKDKRKVIWMNKDDYTEDEALKMLEKFNNKEEGEMV